MTDDKPKCFIAMPITTHDNEAERYGGDKQHWKHVMESLFVPAIEAAGYEPVIPAAKGSFLIHGQIIKHLSETDLVLCDLSSHNPNVFFELGVRTSINLPVALVKDEHTNIPFDTSGINTFQYKSTLHGWDKDDQTDSLKTHIIDSAESCDGKNPLWNQFGLTITAQEPSSGGSPLEAKVDLLMERFDRIDQALPDNRGTGRGFVSNGKFVESHEAKLGRGMDPELATMVEDYIVAAIEKHSPDVMYEFTYYPTRLACAVKMYSTESIFGWAPDLINRVKAIFDVDLSIEHSSRA